MLHYICPDPDRLKLWKLEFSIRAGGFRKSWHQHFRSALARLWLSALVTTYCAAYHLLKHVLSIDTKRQANFSTFSARFPIKISSIEFFTTSIFHTVTAPLSFTCCANYYSSRKWQHCKRPQMLNINYHCICSYEGKLLPMKLRTQRHPFVAEMSIFDSMTILIVADALSGVNYVFFVTHWEGLICTVL